MKGYFYNCYVKRVLDFIGAIVLIIIFLPLSLLVALLIKITSRGSVLYSGVAVGRGGKPFQLYKFRTMTLDNDNSSHREATKKLVTENSPCSIDDNGQPLYKIRKDDRITTVGHYLRRFSIDEFPQLLNVLKGEMSLVGPRPSVFYEYEHYKNHHQERLRVLPGITGLYQVTKRYRANFEEMVELDKQYIHKLSLIADLKILAKTPIAMLKGL